MILSGNFWQPTIDFTPFHEKPPLFSWLQSICFQIFGINEMAARLPNVCCGGITLACLFYIGRRWHSVRLGAWWALFMAFSILPQLYFRSGIIDPWFNLFIFLSLANLLPLKQEIVPGWFRIFSSGILLGLAILTKGPVAALIVGGVLAINLWYNKRKLAVLWYRYALVGTLALLPIACWIAYIWQLDDGFFAREFLAYQWRLFIKEDAGHGGFPGYHVVVLLLGCFPASIFALPSLIGKQEYRATLSRQGRLLKILFWVVLVLFTIVNTKIIHYSSLAYFPLTFLAAREVVGNPKILRRWAHFIGLGIWGAFSIMMTTLPLLVTFLLPKITIKDFDYQSSNADGVLELAWFWLAGLPLLGLLYLLHSCWKKGSSRLYAGLHLAGATYLVVAVLLLYVGRVQQVTQGANVAFFSSLSDQQPYYGMAYRKSYVPLFYGEVSSVNGGRERHFRFHGQTDRSLYFSSPQSRTEQVLREVPDAKLLYQKGGFSFYHRPAVMDSE